MVLAPSPVAVTQTSDFAPASSKKFLDMQATTECGFTLKHVRDMRRTCSQFNHAVKKCDIFKMAEMIFQEVW